MGGINMRWSIILGFLALLSVQANAASSVGFLTQAEIKNKLVGHSYAGTEDGVAYIEKIMADGTVRGTDKTGPYSGKWKIKSTDLICFHFNDSKNWDCSRVNLKGNRIKWIGQDGTVTISTFTSTEPRNTRPPANDDSSGDDSSSTDD
jgi:hypothetical protein